MIEMDYTKVMGVVQSYATLIESKYPGVTPAPMDASFAKLHSHHVPILTEYRHHLWMCCEIMRGDMSLAKAMRWLGWLNFFIYQQGWMTLDEIKDLSRPDPNG